MNSDQHLEKTLTTIKEHAITLINYNIALDFNVLIKDKGQLSFVDPFTIKNLSRKTLKSYSITSKVREYCERALSYGKCIDYMCVYFQKGIIINSEYHLNVFIITGSVNSPIDFGYLIYPYDWSKQGELEIYNSIRLDYSAMLLIENQALGLLSTHVLDN